MSPMLESRKMRWAFMLSTVVLLLISVSLFFTKSVPVKMLPFDNKNEFQVVIDMPEGTTLERTAVVTKEIAAYVALNKDVVNYQTYVGTSGPINFNGLARHYDLRRGENMADIQINLSNPKKKFNVKTASMDVSVLGTSFDVCSFPKKNIQSVVLVSGRVKVTPDFGETITMAPNQKYVYDKSGKKNVLSNVDRSSSRR